MLWKSGSLGMVAFIPKNGFFYNPDSTVMTYTIIHNKALNFEYLPYFYAMKSKYN